MIDAAEAEERTRPARREARIVAGALDLAVVALIGVCCLLLALALMLLQVNPLERDPTAGEWAVGYAAALLLLPAAAVYVALAPRTLGARLLQLRIEPLSPLRAVLRGLLWWPSLFCFGVGLWWPWLDPEGRSPADLLSGTRLVEVVEAAGVR